MVKLWVDMFHIVTWVVIACLILYVYTNKKLFKSVALGGLIIQFCFALFSLYSYFDLKNTKFDADIMVTTICMEILRSVAIYLLISHKHINTSSTSAEA